MPETFPTQWLECTLDATAEAIDWLRTIVAAHDARGKIEVTPIVADAWTVRIRLAVPYDGRRRRDAERLLDALAPLERTGLISWPAADVVDAQPRYDSPALMVRTGERIVLALGEGVTGAGADDLVVRLPSNLAFGSGFHPATILMLRLLERHVRFGMHALDLGSGSGVLSVALARLGASVVAIDNDPVAVAATRATVAHNDVAEQVAVQRASLGSGGQRGHWMGWTELADAPALPSAPQFDIIAANVLARLHAELAAEYRAVLRPGGIALTAGYEQDRADAVAEAMQRSGLALIDQTIEGAWIAQAFGNQETKR